MLTAKIPPFAFFIAITFLISAPLLYFATTSVSIVIQILAFLSASYGVAAAAWLTMRVYTLRDESAAFFKRIFLWRTGFRNYALSVGIPTLIWFVTATTAFLMGLLQNAAWINFAALPIVFVTNFGEEIGWRGFALPHLMRSFRPLTASLVLGLVWGAFHLPLYTSNPPFAFLFLALAPALSILLTWLFLASRGSVLLTTLFHALFNTWTQVFLVTNQTEILAIATTVTWLAAILLIIRYGPALAHPTATGNDQTYSHA